MRRIDDLIRYAFPPVALLLFFAVAVLGSLSFQRQLDSFQPTGLEVQRALGTWQVAAVMDEGTGILPDDEIVLVDGQLAGDLSELESLLTGSPAADLVVVRGGVPLTVTYQRPQAEIDWAYLLLVAVALLYLAIGLYTAFKDRRSPARLFFFWCLSIATIFLLSPILPPRDQVDRWIFLVDQLSRILLPALTLHLFLVFPTSLMSAARTRMVIPFAYVPTLFLAAFHLDQGVFGGRLLFGAAGAATLIRVDRLELLLIVGFHLLAAVSLMVRLQRGPSWWEQRRQTQMMLFGLLAGYTPFLVLYIAPLSLGWRWPAWTTLLGVAALIAVPLAFAYAILKYKLWDMEIILRDSISYSVTALIGLLGFSLINLLIQRQLADGQILLRNLLAFGAGLTIAGVMVPVKNVIAGRLDRWHYRGALGSRHRLQALGNELLHERDLDALCQTLLESLSQGLAITRANLYLAQGHQMSPVKLGDGLPSALPKQALGDDFWSRDVEGLSGIHLPSDRPSANQLLFVAGYRYALPLLVREERVGVALLSYKEGEQPLNSEDLAIARTLLNQAALAIENARLLDEVHQQLEEVTLLKEHNRGIIESSPAGIAVLDEDDHIVSANHAFAAISGVERPKLAGRPISELIPVHPLPQPGQGLLEVSFCTPGGEERYLQISRALYEQPTRTPLSVLVVLDVSEKMALEIALNEKEQLASLGLLAAGVAHEVNTPITGISSYAQFLLADTDPDDPSYPILKKMERQSFRASQIVNNLLEFARNRRREFGPVDLAAVMAECRQTVLDAAQGSGVEFAGLPLPDLPPIDGSESELHQVFTNLMVNAIDAMAPGGGGVLGISAEADDHCVRVRVSDTGPGIPTARLERIFQPFFSSKLGKGGTGLGLAITYNIVRRHGGEIRAENHRGGPGCTFIVTLRRRLSTTQR